MRRLGAGLLLLLAACGAATAQEAAAAEQLLQLRIKAADAHRARDWPALLESTRRLYELQPARPGNAWNLACAEALNGDFEAAAKLLTGLLDRGIDYGIERDADLAAARESKAFAPLLARARERQKPEGGSSLAFRLPEKDLLTEGIAYDPQTRAFFVSSVHRRKILRRASDGRIADFVREGQDGLDAVLGITVDGRRRLLWACSAAMPQMRGYEPKDEGRTALFAYDLESGRLRRKVTLAPDGKPHVLNDLTVAKNGDVYTTDSVGGGIYVARQRGDSLEEFLRPGIFRSPQGLAFADGDDKLYVADWSVGLFVVDPGTKKREEVVPAAGFALIGVDGLARYGRELVVTQNMLRPHRVLRLTLEAGQPARVAVATVLDQADPEFAEPTLAVIVDDEVFVVGKSQWERFDEKTGAVDEEKLVPPAILRIPLRRRL